MSDIFIPFAGSSGSGSPTGAAGGDLSGTYPNPTIAANAVTDAKVAAANKDGAAGTASMRTLGTGASQAAPGNDSRITGAAQKSGATFTGEVIVPDVSVSGLTGATTATRYVGGTTGGPPTSGTFLAGDFIVTTLGSVWICTVGGSPGTWVAVGAAGFARATSDTTKTSTAALANHAELFVPVVANGVYSFEASVLYAGVTTGDIQIAFTIPSGTIAWTGVGAQPAVSTQTSGTANFTAVNASGTAAIYGGVGAGTLMSARMSGTVVIGATPGNLQLQWAQGTSDPTATTLYTGSKLTAQRVA